MKFWPRLYLILAAALPLPAAADACAGIDRSLSEEDRGALVPVVARQLQVRGVKLLASLRSDAWRVLHISARDTDNSYVFWSADPQTQRFVEAIGEFALPEGEKAIAKWLTENLQGIPKPLAACVAQLAAKGQAG